jgi:hypothetical protein
MFGIRWQGVGARGPRALSALTVILKSTITTVHTLSEINAASSPDEEASCW